MTLTPQDELHLAQALTLAQNAAAFASPNPTVGCILTRDGEIIGDGAHFYDHRDHAEIAALKQADLLGHSVPGATAYVTLEPCAHHGRTGPCSDALIAAGITRCVVATVDPNPRVSGAGLARLRAANVEVVLLDPMHALAQQGRRLNDAFAHFIQQQRPFVTLKTALSVDGMLAPAPVSRASTTPHWLTGSAARADAQLLRHANDAILVGIGTVLADNPSLTDRSGLSRRRPLLRVILDTHLRTPLNSALVVSANDDVLIVTSETAAAANEAALRERGVHVLRLSTSGAALDLCACLSHLAGRDIVSVLVEGGSILNGALLRADLVDRAVLYYAEAELGLDAVPFAGDYGSPYVLQQRLTRATRTAFASDIAPNAEDIRVAGYLHDPWASTPTAVP